MKTLFGVVFKDANNWIVVFDSDTIFHPFNLCSFYSESNIRIGIIKEQQLIIEQFIKKMKK